MVSTFENQNTLNAPKPLEQAGPDKNKLQAELQQWSKTEEKKEQKETRPIEDIVQDLVKLSVAARESAINLLPAGEREKVRQLINAQLSQIDYKQELQAAYPSGTSAIAGEDIPSTMANVSEMQRDSRKTVEVANIGDKLPPETREKFRADREIALTAATTAEQSAENLRNILTAAPTAAKKQLSSQGVDVSRIS